MYKLIDSYQAAWDSSRSGGHFWFIYYDGTRHRTQPAYGLDADNFRTMIDILRNEKPVFGEHTTATVMTEPEEPGEEET